MKDQSAIPYYKPRYIDRAEFFRKIDKVLDSGWLTNAGKNVAELEKKIAEIHGVRHCIAVCNGTIGLQLVFKGLDLTGEVITTPFTFCATAHAVMWQRLRPVFCDIDPETLTISPKRIVEKITPTTSAILGVHVFGQVCNVDAIDQIAKDNNLRVVYDAAHSFMTSYRGKSIGNFGDAEVVSFHATKLFHTFEGGAILTNNSELANKLRLLKNFGFSGMDRVDYLGTNAKMNEISAAWGLSLLPYIPETITKLKYVNEKYRRSLGGVNGLTFFDLKQNVSGNGQYFPIFINEELFGVGRDQLWAFLWDKGIQTRRYFYPTLDMCEPYYTEMPEFRDSFPTAKKISVSVLCLPCYYDLKDQDVERVCEFIHQASSGNENVRTWYDNLLKVPSYESHMAQVVGSLKKSKNI